MSYPNCAKMKCIYFSIHNLIDSKVTNEQIAATTQVQIDCSLMSCPESYCFYLFSFHMGMTQKNESAVGTLGFSFASAVCNHHAPSGCCLWLPVDFLEKPRNPRLPVAKLVTENSLWFLDVINCIPVLRQSSASTCYMLERVDEFQNLKDMILGISNGYKRLLKKKKKKKGLI